MSSAGSGSARSALALLFMAIDRHGEPARRQRKRQAQRLSHLRRDHRPGDRRSWSDCGPSPAVPTSTSPGSSRSTRPADKNAFIAVTTATSLAFFAMVGFEDSVNMAEETKDPVRIFPKVLLTGLGIAGLVYVVVAIIAVALVPVGELAEADSSPLVEGRGDGRTPGCRSRTSCRSSRCSRYPTPR